MLHVRVPCSISVANVHLHATGIPDPSMKEAHAFDHWAYEFQFAFEAAVHKLAACVPMGKVAIETQLREAANKLHRTPSVLEDSCPDFGILVWPSSGS